MWMIIHHDTYTRDIDMGEETPSHLLVLDSLRLKYVGQKPALLAGFYLTPKARAEYRGNGSPKDDVAELLRWGDELSVGVTGPGVRLYQYDADDALVGTTFRTDAGGSALDVLPYVGSASRIIYPNDEINIELHVMMPSDVAGEVSSARRFDFNVESTLYAAGYQLTEPQAAAPVPPVSAYDGLLINEVEFTSPMDSYIELINNSGSAIAAASLASLRLRGYSYDGMMNFELAITDIVAGDWLAGQIIVAGTASVTALLPPGVEYATIADFAFDGAMSAAVRLEDTTDSSIIDAVAWSLPFIGDPLGEGATAPPDSLDVTSVSRDAASTDTDDNATDFSEQLRSPGLPNP